MLTSMAHRGPDDEGIYVDGSIGLGSNRLSIIDLEGGRMPIANEDETVWVVLNGEIYNYRELRDELLSRGHRFRTATDTEVIVHLYEEKGTRCVDKLRGMFAFALWDATEQQLILARDRLGQKPLFYHDGGRRLAFASEIKGLLSLGDIPRETDDESLHDYLSLRFVPSPRTMLKGVRKLPPAHMLVHREGHTSITRYWDVSFVDKQALDPDQWVEEIAARLRETVSLHLVSDVPVGAFLSGGLDSSMVVALMARDASDPIRTFGVGVEESDFNELPYAKAVATRYGTNHIEECVRSELIAGLPRMICHLDEPSDPIAACQYHAAAVAARHVKVVLGGDGGDELFGGFDRYYGLDYASRYAALPSFIRRQLVRPVLEALPDSFTYKSVTQKLRWIDQVSEGLDPAARYAEATCFFRFSHSDKSRLFEETPWRSLRGLDSSEHIAIPYRSEQAEDAIDRMLYADIVTRLPEHSLMLTDRMSMAHSLELRSPFLDHHLVEWMAGCPSDLKIRKRSTKHILRTVARDYLPDNIVRRDKQGFMFPMAYWFRGRLHAFLRERLLSSRLVRDGLFRRVEVVGLLDDHASGRRDNHVRLWMLLNLDVWDRIYIQHEDPDEIARRMSHDVS